MAEPQFIWGEIDPEPFTQQLKAGDLRQDHSAAVRIKEETTRPARSCFLKLNVEREHKGGPETHL